MITKTIKEEKLQELSTLFDLAIKINTSGRLMKTEGVLIVDEQLALALCDEIESHRTNPAVSKIIFVLAHDFRIKAKPCLEQGFVEIDYLLIASLLQEIAHLRFA